MLCKAAIKTARAGFPAFTARSRPVKTKQVWQRTGVRQNAICLDRCLALDCAEDKIEIPCRLPHQTRCDTVWPVGREVAPAFDGLKRNGMAGPDVNLFSEKWSAGPGAEAGEQRREAMGEAMALWGSRASRTR
jgi:hypothetical protein